MKGVFKLISFLYLIFSVGTFFAQSKKNSWIQAHLFDANEIQLSIIFEGLIQVNGEMVNAYTLAWKDTIGQAMQYDSYNRPLEMKVVVRTQDSIVGKYTGLSTQMMHCTFLTNEEFVTIHFWLGRNFFYDGDHDSNTVFRNSYTNNWDKISFNRKEYTPIIVNTSKIDRNNIVDGYDNKVITLQANPNVVRLYVVHKGALHPDPMPNANIGLATGLRKVIALDRYLLYPTSGKIYSGKKWLKKYGIARIAEIDIRIIDPHLYYTEKSGKKIPGKVLIRAKKIDFQCFESEEFSTLQWSLPYTIK